jgi:hypothetical protein
LLTGCVPRAIIAYDVPAELTVPTDVRSLALVDRKGSDFSAAARLALQEELQGGGRYTIAEPAAAQAALGRVQGTVGQPLSADAIAAIRTAAGADGVVAVDQIETVESWSYAERTDTRTHTETRVPSNCASCPAVATDVIDEVPVIDATLSVTVNVGYQLYGVNGAVVDAWTEFAADALTGTAETQADARGKVGDAKSLAADLAAATAFDAARHIAPWSTSVDRTWYAAGGREVASGAKLAKSDDWKGAEKAWREGRKTAEGDAKGRVIYDLAVAAERRGDIATALKLVKEAKPLLRNTKRADAYQTALRDRKREAATLAAQMAPPPEGE